MSETVSVVELVNQVTEFNDLSEFMGDEDLDAALAYVVRLIANPDVAASKAPVHIVKLQALSAKFGMLGQYYQTLRKGPSGSGTGVTAGW